MKEHQSLAKIDSILVFRGLWRNSLDQINKLFQDNNMKNTLIPAGGVKAAKNFHGSEMKCKQ